MKMANVFLILRICKTLIGLMGVLGNGLVIMVICRVRFMHTLTNGFICHQAVIDFLGSLLLILQSNIPVPMPVPETLGGEVLCRMWIGDALLWVLFVTSTFSLLALTLERYTAIVYPFRFQTIFTQKAAIVMMVVVWLIGLALKSYSFVIYTVVDGKCIFVSLAASKVMGPLLICLQYFVPSAIMLFCYSHITITLHRNARQIVPMPTNPREADGNNQAPTAMGQQQRPLRGGSEQQESLLRARRNTFKTLLIVFVTFLVCWTPSQVTFFLFNVGLINVVFDGPLNVINTVLVASNCCLNPIIYSFKYKQFRQALRKFIGRPEVQVRGDGLQTSAITLTTNQSACATVTVDKPSINT